MGCGVNGCCSKKPDTVNSINKTNSKKDGRPIKPFRRNSEAHETETDGINLFTANLGHYFMENELYEAGFTIEEEKKFLTRLQKWRKMCSTVVDESNQNNIKLPEIEKKVTLYVESGIKESDAERSLSFYAKGNPKVFYKRLVKGPSPRYRWIAWKIALKVLVIEVPGLYEGYKKKMQTTEWLTTIVKDLDRTFPTHPLFGEYRFNKKGQESLASILAVYALYNPNVGYCQGMNFMVGFLMILSGYREEEVFWMFVALTKYKTANDQIQMNGIEGFYMDGFPGLLVIMRLFKEAMAICVPEIKNHLDDVGFPDELWLLKWISTLFLYSLPMSTCIRLWDYLFEDGTSGIIKVGIVILKGIKNEILEGDFNECNEAFKNLKDGKSLFSADDIISEAVKLTIDWAPMELLKQQTYLEVQHEIDQRKKKKAEEEESKRKKEEIKITLSQRQEEFKFEDINSDDEQRGKACGLPSIVKLEKTHAIPNVQTIEAPKETHKEEGSFLPPIKPGRSNQFIFECNSEILKSHDLDNKKNEGGLSERSEEVKSELSFTPQRHPQNTIEKLTSFPVEAKNNVQGEERKDEEEQMSHRENVEESKVFQSCEIIQKQT